MVKIKEKITDLKTKRRNFNILALATTLVLIGVLVFVTLFAYESPFSYDMTKDKVFTLSTYSESVLDSVDEKVEIAVVYPRGREDSLLKSLLEVYKKNSDSNIDIEYIDAELEAGLLAKYNLNLAAVTNGTVIVKGSKRTKVLNVVSFYSTTMMGSSFSGERQLTGAIRYVTAEDLPKVYFIEGHGEANLSDIYSKFKQYIEVAAYEVDTYNLVGKDKVPEDAAVLVCASAKSDYTPEEVELIDDYINKGGATIFMFDVLNESGLLPNLSGLMQKSGVEIQNSIIVEEDAESHFSDIKTILIPQMGFHEITIDIIESKSHAVFPNAMALNVMDDVADNLKISVLAQSTMNSWIRSELDISSVEFTSADKAGPAVIAVAVEREQSKDAAASKSVIYGNTYFLTNDNIDMQANFDMFINSVNWVLGNVENDQIYPKIINADTLYIRGSDFVKLAIIVIGVIPLLAFAAAFIVWIRRRNL